MGKSNKSIFLDTNIFLHYEFFTNINWTAIVDAGEVKLIVAPIILRELEKHKFSLKDKILRQRVEKVTARLAKIGLENKTVRPNASLYFDLIEPEKEFSLFQLSKETQDDQLLASILSYRERNPDEIILLVTNDLPLRLKAPQHFIETISLSDDLKIPIEASLDEKKIKKLEQEIRELKNRVPQPELVFKSGENYIKFHREQNSKFETDIPESLEEVKNKYPKIYNPKNGENRDLMLANPLMTASHLFNDFHPADIEKYNEKLDSFYKSYEKYLADLAEWKDYNSRALKLDIILSNKGTAPVEHAIVFMTIAQKDFIIQHIGKNKPSEVFPPEKPIPRMDNIARYFERVRRDEIYINDNLRHSNLLREIKSNRESEPPNIIRNNFNQIEDSYEISFEVRKATQGLIYSCPYNLFLVFDSLETARSFKIEYKIIADNLPKPKTGSLNVVVK